MGDSTDERPTGRELRLVNATVSLLGLLMDGNKIPPGIVLSEPVLRRFVELHECAEAYKRHMLKPRMKRHTLIPVIDLPLGHSPPEQIG